MADKAKNYDRITKMVLVLSMATLCGLAVAAWRERQIVEGERVESRKLAHREPLARTEIKKPTAIPQGPAATTPPKPEGSARFGVLPEADRHALAPVVAYPPGYDIDVEIDEALLLILKQESDYCRDTKAHGNYWQTTKRWRDDVERLFGFYPDPADFETTMKAIRLWLKYYAPIYGAVTAADIAKMYNLGPTGFRRWKFCE